MYRVMFLLDMSLGQYLNRAWLVDGKPRAFTWYPGVVDNLCHCCLAYRLDSNPAKVGESARQCLALPLWEDLASRYCVLTSWGS